MSLQVHNFIWHDRIQDFEIEVLYFPLKFGVISHLEIRTLKPKRAPLPITETGYLSHHFHPDSVDFNKINVIEFMTNWLDQEARNPKWIEQIEQRRQLDLFR